VNSIKISRFLSLQNSFRMSKKGPSVTPGLIWGWAKNPKKILWGGEFWSDGYFVSTVGKHGDEEKIGNYIKNQGNVYSDAFDR